VTSLNRRAKRWPGWVVLLIAVVALLAVGATRDTGPRTPDERVEAISKRLACPVCQGESVYESRNPASVQIREAVKQGVADGVKSDEQIIQDIVVAYDGEELLVPTASGIEALAWALPAAALVIGVTGLTLAFRRWQASARSLGDATDDDYALVAEALADFDAADDPGDSHVTDDPDDTTDRLGSESASTSASPSASTSPSTSPSASTSTSTSTPVPPPNPGGAVP
jgi:cytochrome c-type biogenesis protein CcmH